MKKVLVVATGLAVLSTGAYASKARVNALQNSFLVTDTRDILTNPADLNNMKNFVITEWGANTEAEGGFFKDAGKFAYGFYLGDDTYDNTPAEQASATFLKKDNNIDLFFAGDMGVQWGAKLSYASAKDELNQGWTKEHNALGFALGANYKEAYFAANLSIKDESKGSTASANDKFENDLGYSLQAGYNLMGFDLNATYEKSSYEQTISGTKTGAGSHSYSVGVGKVHEVAKTARLFTDLVWSEQPTATKALKATVGYEADATSWLVLRGALSQNVMGYQKMHGKKATTANTTDVSAGATLNFGQLKVDGMIGTTDNTGAQAEDGTLRTDYLLTQVAVHYWF